MIKILDLFAGTQSVRKALTKKYSIDYWECINGVHLGISEGGAFPNQVIVQYIGVDIVSPKRENKLLNLAQPNIIEWLKHKLPNNWKPDFIWASPVCNKFSAAVTGPKGNAYFIVEGGKIRLRRHDEYKDVKHNGICNRPKLWDKYANDALIALQLHTNTKMIIDNFDVPFVIENPWTSLAKYVYFNYYKNKADYCAYGFEYKKPTAFYSKGQLDLKLHNKNETHIHRRFDRINKTTNFPTHWDKDISMYANRSSVLPKLIEDILDQMLGDING